MDNLNKRFLPLYIATFFSGLVFWYAIEKLFMAQIGFNDSTIILAMILSTVCILVFEMPSGFLADRWSRKGVLTLGYISLSLSSLAGYLSYSPLPFLFCAAFWGIYYAMNSGAVESVIYDTLLEERGNRHGFEKYFGKTRTLISVSLVSGSLLGGIISELFDPRITFLITVPCSIIGLISLSVFKEPTLHKTETEISTTQHLKNSLKLFKSTQVIIAITLSMVLLNTVYRFIFEYHQLWLITLGVSAAYFGIIMALLNTSFGIAGYFTHIFQARGVTVYALGLGATISVCGLFFNSLPVVVISIFASIILTSMANVMLTGKLHDQVSSSQRSGISSTVSTIASIVFILTSVISSYLTTFSLYWSVPLLIGLSLFGALKAKKLT